MDPNIEPFYYWHQKRYTSESLDNFIKKYTKKCLFAKVALGERFKYEPSEKAIKQKDARLPLMGRLLASLQEEDNLDIEFILWLDDGVYRWQQAFAKEAPLLGYGRQKGDHYAFLIPDPGFWGSNAYQRHKEGIAVVESKRPWKTKVPAAVWRGAAGGHWISKEDWLNAPRIKICQMAKESELIEAAISYVPNYVQEITDRITALNVIKGVVPIYDFVPFKYQVDIDGFSCSWISCFFKLLTDSVLLKVEGQQEQWYYHRLQAWQHYVPVSESLDELEELILWLRAHDKEAHEISIRGGEFINSITYRDAYANLIVLLRKLRDCYDG